LRFARLSDSGGVSARADRENENQDRCVPENVGWKRVEWSAAEMSKWSPPPNTETGTLRAASFASPIGFRALNDLSEITTNQNQLSGEVIGAAPVLQFALWDYRGGADRVKFFEVRLNV
jgi:hypothetical protein